MDVRTILAALLPLLAAAQAAPPARPNVIILYADDMGWGDLGVQNPDSRIPTPHLDRLAQEGMRFTDAHSSSGVCTPSRYALLQGRYHWRKFHGIVGSFDGPVLEPERPTLAALLKGAGYATACFGKWHLGWDWASIRRPGAKPGKAGYEPGDFDWTKPIPGGPLSFGFDRYAGDDVPNFPPYAWFEDDRIPVPPTHPLSTPPATAEGQWEARPGPSVEGWDFHAVLPRITESAADWLRRRKAGQPFFLYVPFTSPHAPIVPGKDFVGRSKAGGYGDFVVQTDEAVGRILKALDETGLAKDTIVVFSSDNGPEHYAYERVRATGHRSMGPYRGLKRDLYEAGHRVPFLVRWPGVVPAGRVSDGLLSQIDVYATVAAAAGIPVPAGSAEDSLDQTALWKGTGPGARRTLVHNTNPNGYALRHGDWVLIQAPSGAISKVPDWFAQAEGHVPNPHPGELYNLRADPGQKHNLYDQNPEKVAELAAMLQDLKAKAGKGGSSR